MHAHIFRYVEASETYYHLDDILELATSRFLPILFNWLLKQDYNLFNLFKLKAYNKLGNKCPNFIKIYKETF